VQPVPFLPGVLDPANPIGGAHLGTRPKPSREDPYCRDSAGKCAGLRSRPRAWCRRRSPWRSGLMLRGDRRPVSFAGVCHCVAGDDGEQSFGE
jgi:hypothetical protein